MKLVALVLALFFLSGCAGNIKTPMQIIKGRYEVLSVDNGVPDNSRIEVEIFFGYQCHHCYTLYNESLKSWMQAVGEDVKVVLVPSLLTKQTGPSIRAFHVGEALNVNPKLHEAIFIRTQRMNVYPSSQKELAGIASTCCGVNGYMFSSIYNSEITTEAIKASIKRSIKYNIVATPAIVVNGKYMVSPERAGGQAQMMAVVDVLINEERDRMKKSN